MTDTDWHDAQVIEAEFYGKRVIATDEGDGWWSVDNGESTENYELSDVRVIVDRDGKVAPPPITDEMVMRYQAHYLKRHQLVVGDSAARDALRAALGGSDD